MTTFQVRTNSRQLLPITNQVQKAVTESGLLSGLCAVFCPHTTAAITINENADPDVARDLLFALEESSPDRSQFRHMEGNSPAHMKASMVGASVTVPIEDGRLALGRWQGIYFCEFDGPRTRQFHVQVLG